MEYRITYSSCLNRTPVPADNSLLQYTDYAIPDKYFTLQKIEVYPRIYQAVLKYRTIIWGATSEMTTQIWPEHRDKAIYDMHVDKTSSVSELGGRGRSDVATWWIAKYRKPRTTVNNKVCVTANIPLIRSQFTVHKVQGLDNAWAQFEFPSKNLRFCKCFIITTIIPRILLFLTIATSCCACSYLLLAASSETHSYLIYCLQLPPLLSIASCNINRLVFTRETEWLYWEACSTL